MKKNSKSRNRRTQTPKNPLAGSRMPKDMLDADLGRRGSSAGMPHKSVKDYRRKPKHVGRGWE